jgi:hypothetical protein
MRIIVRNTHPFGLSESPKGCKERPFAGSSKTPHWYRRTTVAVGSHAPGISLVLSLARAIRTPCTRGAHRMHTGCTPDAHAGNGCAALVHPVCTSCTRAEEPKRRLVVSWVQGGAGYLSHYCERLCAIAGRQGVLRASAGTVHCAKLAQKQAREWQGAPACPPPDCPLLPGFTQT